MRWVGRKRGLLHGKGSGLGLAEGFGTISLNMLLSGRHRKKLDTVTLLANAGLERWGFLGIFKGCRAL